MPRRGRPRPPWWPDGEEWPPKRARSRQRFLRRIGCFFGAFLLFIVIANIISYKVLNTRWEGGNRPPWPIAVIFPIVIIVIVVTVIGRVLRRTAAPIGDVMDAADRVAAGDYTVRVEPRGTGEVRQLAASFNEMTTRLQATEEQRRHLLADVAHEFAYPTLGCTR